MFTTLSLIFGLAQPPGEVVRLQQHFARVDLGLQAWAPAGLSADQHARREALRTALAEYAEAGLFPVNDHSLLREPTFIDAADTRCAMAHLLEITGEEDVARRIAVTDNHVQADDLRTDPTFVAWLEHHGLTPEDGAFIQPAYEPPLYACVCGSYWENLYAEDFNTTIVELEGVEGGRFLVRRHVAGEPAFEPGQTITEADLAALEALHLPESPHLVGLGEPYDDGRRKVVPIPNFQPCPDGTNVRGPVPAAPSEALMVQAVMAGPECRQVMLAADARWDIEPEDPAWAEPGDDGGCRMGSNGGNLLFLLMIPAIVRRRRMSA